MPALRFQNNQRANCTVKKVRICRRRGGKRLFQDPLFFSPAIESKLHLIQEDMHKIREEVEEVKRSKQAQRGELETETQSVPVVARLEETQVD